MSHNIGSFTIKNQQIDNHQNESSDELTIYYPCLLDQVSCYGQQIIISQNSQDYQFLINQESASS